MDAVKVVCKKVNVLVFRHRQGRCEYLLLRRTKDRGGYWQPVKGRIEKGEGAEDTAQRELFEETGFQVNEFIYLDKVHIHFKPGKRRIHLEPCFGVGINGVDPRLCQEHDDHAWLEHEQARERLAHTGLREALDELHDRLRAAPPSRLAERSLAPVLDGD